MKINVGSKNAIKIKSVEDTFALYPHLFPELEVVGVDVNVELYGHPKSLSETVDGAIARAKEAFVDCDFSVGLEGGLLQVPHTKTGHVETSVCAIYDGKNIHLGLGPSFEFPKKVTEFIVEGRGDASQGMKKFGFVEHEKIGTAEGAVSFLTGGKMTRSDQTKYSILMALVHLEHPEAY